MVDNACEICGLPQSTTKGIYFGLNPDKKSYYAMPDSDVVSGDVVIGVYNGLSVTEVDGFVGIAGLKSIVIADCVTTLGTFEACTELKTVTIGNGVREIVEGAFRGCTALTMVTIGDNVVKIGEKAFSGCTNLYAVYISGAHDWMHTGNRIYGNWIGKENGMSTQCARHLKEKTFEWNRL